MADRYAPAVFLEVLAFWFVLRWLLVGRLVLLLGRLLVLMTVVGTIGTLRERHYVWATCFAGAALLSWLLLRGSRHRGVRAAFRLPAFLAWRSRAPTEVASLCERRIGLLVDAAAPAKLAGDPPAQCVLALAGDGLWVLEDQSRLRHPQVGRVLASWDRITLVSHVEHSRRGERFEFSWPRDGALVRGVMPSGEAADLLAGHLVADQFAPR
jgi:hypothetical protein